MSNETGNDGLEEVDKLLRTDKKFRSSYRGKAIRAARQLGYSRDVILQIKNAKSDIKIEQIMYQAAKDTRDRRDRELGRA